MPDDLTAQVGLGVAIAVILLEKCFAFIKGMKQNGGSENQTTGIPLEQWNDVENKINELHSLHTKFDADGVPLWYVKITIYEKLKHIRDIVDRIDAKTH